ncbi:hypothetical protein ACHAPJ_009693 [Fusarium lateritium]
MVALQQQRREDPNRPLIFVTHSLGGILVKVALIKSKSSRQPKLLPIFESTKGIVFLGTPHSGSKSATWGLLATNLAKFALQGSNQKVLRGLVPNSELLETFSEQFRQLLDEGGFSVHSFYETQTMSTLYGIEDVVVPYSSATLGDVKRETIMGINANHRGICKFSSIDDHGYKAVIGAILDYLEASPSREASVSDVGKSYAFHQQQIPSREDIASLATLSGETGVPADMNFEAWHSNISLTTITEGKSAHYLSAIGLSNTDIKTYWHPPPVVQEEEESIKYGWFFDSLDFSDWDGDDLTKVLQLGSQNRQENSAVSLELFKVLKERGSRVIYFSSWFSDGERNVRLKPLEHGHRILRSIISQLAEGNLSLLLDLVGHEAMYELETAQPLVQASTMLNSLTRLLYYVLVSQQVHRTYLLIDGLDVLGHEMGPFIGSLLSLQERLRKSKTAHQQPVVKVFISTPPQARVRALGQKKDTDEIIYMEKNKEMEDCLQTLYTADFDARPATIHDPDSDTYNWLEEDASYEKWESSDSSSLLLIQGKPGSGKSTLAKIIVQTIQNSKDFEDSLVAYFFYSYRGGQKETSHTIMMQSVLYQLLSQEPEFFPAFRERYRARQRSDVGTVHWTLNDLVEIFDALSNVKREGKVFIILDAMDESDNEDLPVILKTMSSICSARSLGLFKGVMTTRPLQKKATDERVKSEFNGFLKDIEKSEPARYLLLGTGLSFFLATATDDDIQDASDFRFNAMVLASRRGYERAIRILTTANAPTEPTDDDTETTALHAAIEGGQRAAVELLLNFHAWPYFRDVLGEVALHKAVACGQLEIARTLLETDVFVDLPNLTHETALHLAAARGNGDMVKLLLDYQADADAADQYDATPLHKAVANNHVVVAEILLQHGAEVDADANYTGTPLHIAVDNKSIAMANLLLEHKAPVNEAGEYGATALHSAASEGQTEMIALLIEHGADRFAKDRYGLTASNWAKANGHSHVLDMLYAVNIESGEETSQQLDLSEIEIPFSVIL